MFFNIPIEEEDQKMEVGKDNLLIQVGRGDMEAFQQLYIQFRHGVYGFALSILKNKQDAEDVMQDTFLRVKAASRLYEERQKPMAWILTITRNLCYMRLREEKHKSTLTLEDIQNQIEFSKVENVENRMLLEKAFTILSAEERQIVILHGVTGLRHREIAALMEVPLPTVLSKYRRALAKLKKQLL